MEVPTAATLEELYAAVHKSGLQQQVKLSSLQVWSKGRENRALASNEHGIAELPWYEPGKEVQRIVLLCC